MKSFLIRLLYLVPFFAIVSVVNYGIDINRFINLDVINQAVLWVKEGNNVAQIHRYHGRYFNKKYIEELDESKEVIVLGSSKVDKIGNSLFPNKSFYNFFLADATIFESLSFFRLIEKEGYHPEKIVLELNPYSFRVKPNPTEMVLGKNYNEMLTQIGEEDQKIKFLKAKQITIDLKQLFSVNYFLVNLKFKRQLPIITTDTIGKRLILKDGSSAREHYFDPNITEIMLRKEIRNLAIEMAKPYREEKVVLRNFIKYLTEVKNIEVSLFVLPLHPKVYEHSELQPELAEWNAYLSFLEKNFDINIIGGTDPHEFGLTTTNFVDLLHVSRPTFSKLFKLHRIGKDEINGSD